MCGRWGCKYSIQFYLAYENDFQCIYVYNSLVTDSSVNKWLEPHLGPFIQQKGWDLSKKYLQINLKKVLSPSYYFLYCHPLSLSEWEITPLKSPKDFRHKYYAIIVLTVFYLSFDRNSRGPL